MPFDGDLKSHAFVHPGPFAGGHAGLRQLRDVLRGPLPVGHTWDFRFPYYETECGTAGCAIGVACVVWPSAARHLKLYHGFAWIPFGITEDEWHDIFGIVGNHNSTPADVADRIDAVLARYGDSTA